MDYTIRTQKVNEAIEKFGDKFQAPNYATSFGTFSDLMWQILINETMADHKAAFTVVVRPYANEVVMAVTRGGYFKTSVMFVNDNFDICCELCKELNAFIFDLTKEAAAEIVEKSLSNGRA